MENGPGLKMYISYWKWGYSINVGLPAGNPNEIHVFDPCFWPIVLEKGGLQHSRRCCNRWTYGRSCQFSVVDTDTSRLACNGNFLGPGDHWMSPPILAGDSKQCKFDQICKCMMQFCRVCLKKNSAFAFSLCWCQSWPWIHVGSLAMPTKDNGSTFKWSQRLEGQWFSWIWRFVHPYFDSQVATNNPNPLGGTGRRICMCWTTTRLGEAILGRNVSTVGWCPSPWSWSLKRPRNDFLWSNESMTTTFFEGSGDDLEEGDTTLLSCGSPAKMSMERWWTRIRWSWECLRFREEKWHQMSLGIEESVNCLHWHGRSVGQHSKNPIWA